MRLTANIALLAALARLATPSASADTFYWDPTQTGGAGGGVGIWDFSSPFWATAATGGTNTTWVDGSDATFDGTPNVVTLSGPISVQTLTFSTVLGYTITTAAGAPLTITGGIVAPAITVPTGAASRNNIDGAGGVILLGNQTVNTARAINIKTTLSGSDIVTKTGDGTLGLSADNTATFTGRFVVNQGTLGFNADAALGAVPTSFRADNITLNGGILAMGVDFTATNSHTNAVAATLDANRGITLGSSGGTIRVGFAGAATLTVNGVISGTGNFTKSDGGTLILTADNTYTGNTTITGVLQLGNGGTTGSLGTGSTITFATGTQELRFNRSDATEAAPLVIPQAIVTTGRANLGVAAGQTVQFTGATSGAGEVWKWTGAGTLVLEGNAASNRTSNGGVREGTLQVSDLTLAATSPLGTGNFYIGHSSLNTAVAGLSYTGPSVSYGKIQNFQSINSFIEVVNPSTTLTITNRIVSQSYADAAYEGGYYHAVLNKTGAGTLSFTGSDDNNVRVRVTEGTLLLGKTSTSTVHSLSNSFGQSTPALVQDGGIVRITGTGGDQVFNGSTVWINAGVFDLNGQSEAFARLMSDGSNGVVTNGLTGSASILTLGHYAGSSVFGGSIQDGAGNIGLIKNEGGSLTLTGTNILGGGATLNAGRLIVTGSLLTGSPTQVNGGVFGGTGTVGDVSVSGGTVSPGATAAGPAIGTLTTGTLDLTSNGTLEIAIDTASLASSLAQLEGSLNLGFTATVLSLVEVGTATAAPVGTTFTIVSYSTGLWDTGNFLFPEIGTLEDGDEFAFGPNTFRIDYDATGGEPGTSNVVLTVVGNVPEPGAGLLLFGGATLLAGLRRRRKA